MPKVIEQEEFTGEKDLSGHRVWILDNGNKIHFVKHDPYGFWTINYDKGTVPVRLTGQYTDYPEASRHAKSYLEQIERTVTEVQDSSIQPDLEANDKIKRGKKWQEARPSQ